MNIAPSIARRYLFSKSGTHFINVIARITIFGLSIGSAALILVLSVFNGFEELIASMINTFNPDLKILPVQGKYFEDNPDLLNQIKEIPGVSAVARTVEEIAIFEYDKVPKPGRMKGVDPNFLLVNHMDSAMMEGEFLLEDDDTYYAVLGSGMARDLSVDVLNMFNQMAVYMANRKSRNLQKPFKTSYLRPAGVFSIQQDIDNEYILVPFDFAISLLDREGMVGAWEIKLDQNSDPDHLEEQIQLLLGPDFLVQNRYEQDEEFRKIMNIEKWMAFAIAALMLLLIAFNLVGCLWMIVLDKRKDISILKAMGATAVFIRKLFIRLGIYFTGLGLGLGLVLASIFYLLQINFGIVGIPEGFVVDTYPIKMKAVDLIVVTATVLLIGFITSLPAAKRASKFSASIREN